MAHILPVKIECRSCLGDGFTMIGYTKPMKLTCKTCEGTKRQWISPIDLRDSDVVLK